MTQKAKMGGWPSRAPIGYLNVREKVISRDVSKVALQAIGDLGDGEAASHRRVLSRPTGSRPWNGSTRRLRFADSAQRRTTARRTGRSFASRTAGYASWVACARCTTGSGPAVATRLAWRKPRIARIPRTMPAATIPYPAHSAIVATVHHP